MEPCVVTSPARQHELHSSRLLSAAAALTVKLIPVQRHGNILLALSRACARRGVHDVSPAQDSVTVRKGLTYQEQQSEMIHEKGQKDTPAIQTGVFPLSVSQPQSAIPALSSSPSRPPTTPHADLLSCPRMRCSDVPTSADLKCLYTEKITRK
ncbi:hypothetical protein EYF80_023416 [Liparis tanakae]|uniref:Uncharacterized protein n=1 Tax=Liparis tanakae TaxID=230148 RepID=A0A4Z2HKZ0_9TELE|nr:hypothetical protein EYF80_023416 [Liparis tanakae]